MVNLDLKRIRLEYQETPNGECRDAMWVALLQYLEGLEERVAALECPTCRRMDTSCCEEHEEID